MTSGKKKFVITVYGPLGGQGSSFIASQLVHHLAKSGPSCLLDLNLDHSTALRYLNLKPAEAFRETALAGEDTELLSTFAIKVEKNYFAVGAPLFGYGQFATETSDSVKDFFDLCRAEFDYTVIDLPRPLHVELTKTVLAMSDLILAISENTNHSAKACSKLKQILSEPKMQVDAGKLAFLFNKSVTQSTSWLPVVFLLTLVLIGVPLFAHFFFPHLLTNIAFMAGFVLVLVAIFFLTPRNRDQTRSSLKILGMSGIKPFHQLPQDRKSCRMAINQGEFLEEKSKIGRALIELSDKIRERLSSAVPHN